MKPLISVIIPVCNAAEYLDECLDSVLGQSLREIQVVIVEDGSTDASPEILRRRAAADSRIMLIEGKHAGVSTARNRGIEQADGQWISFVDADDMLHPYALETLLTAATTAHAQVAVAGYTTKEPFESDAPRPSHVKVHLHGGETAMVRTLLQRGMDNAVWAKLFNAKLLDPGTRFRPGRFEDLDIIYRIYDRAHRVCVMKEPLYYYRPNPQGFINNVHAPGRFDALAVCDRLLAYTQLYSTRVKQAAHVRSLAAAYNALGLIIANGLDKPATKRHALKMIRCCRSRALTTCHARWRDRLGAAAGYLPDSVKKTLAATWAKVKY